MPSNTDKPGDRVRVRGFARDEKGTITRVDHTGTSWYVADGSTRARPISSFERVDRINND